MGSQLHPASEIVRREQAPLVVLVDADPSSRAWLCATLEGAGYRADQSVATW